MVSLNLPESPRETFCVSSFSLLFLYPPFGSQSTRCASSLQTICQVTDILLEKPTSVHAKGRCGAHCGYHVLCVVHHQSPWNWTCRKAARQAPWFRPGVGNGLQSHVLYLQHGHACDVRSVLLSPYLVSGAGLGLYSTGTRQTLRLAQRPPPPRFSRSCFRFLLGFRSLASLVLSSAPLPIRSTARPYGTPSSYSTCS